MSYNKFVEYLNKRDKMISKSVSKMKVRGVEYWDWKKVLDTKYQVYILITKRNIGKTYSALQTSIEAYEEKGLYSILLRKNSEELRKVMSDYKGKFPVPLKDYYKLRGNILYDTRGEREKPVIFFRALSTAYNLKSIAGGNCFWIIYEEFLTMSKVRVRTNEFALLTDLSKSYERDGSVNLILQANTATLNSELLFKFNIWSDTPDFKDEKNKVWYRKIDKWDDPTLEDISLASLLKKKDKRISDYMDGKGYLTDGGGEVKPLSLLKETTFIENYILEGKQLHYGQYIDKGVVRYYVGEGHKGNPEINIPIALDTESNHERNSSLSRNIYRDTYHIFDEWFNSNLKFTTFEIREMFLRLETSQLSKYVDNDKIERKR